MTPSDAEVKVRQSSERRSLQAEINLLRFPVCGGRRVGLGAERSLSSFGQECAGVAR